MILIHVVNPHSSDKLDQLMSFFVNKYNFYLYYPFKVPFCHATGARVQQVLPDPEPVEAAAGGVLPARLVLHQRDRYEHGPQG